MSDPTVTPTPTEARQDVPMLIEHEAAWDAVEASIYLTPEAKVEVQTILDTLAKRTMIPAPSPAVSAPDLDAIRARADAATPGPWRTWNDGHVGSPTVHIGGGVMPTPGSDPAQRMPDAEFIAHARTDIPALLAALAAAHAETERLRRAVADQADRMEDAHTAQQREGLWWQAEFGHAVCQRDEARAALAALRERIEASIAEFERDDAECLARLGRHDQTDLAILAALRALAAAPSETEEGRRG